MMGACNSLASTVRNHYGKFSEKGMQCLQSLYLWVHTILKATCLFLLEVSHNLLQAFVFLKIAEPNVQKPLDESNKINTDDLMGMTLIEEEI